MKDKKIVLQNILYAFTAQGVALLLSILMSLIVPKILGVEEYAYWQLFLFYTSYVGFFHFGLNDGIYLRLGGKSYEKLNYSLIGTQIKITTIFQLVLALIVIVIASFFINDKERMFVLICTGTYLVLHNLHCFIGFIFQAVNKTRIYSISIMIEKLLFLLIVVSLLVLKINDSTVFILLYNFGKVITVLYCLYEGRRLIFSKVFRSVIVLKEMWLNISIGIKLTIANISSTLVIGIGRFIIDTVWGIETFGKFSFSLSLTQFVLLFISQVSMVLFPTLRQIDTEKQKVFYINMRNLLELVLPIVYIAYIPIKYLLGLWLPQYQVSLEYLVLLLPLCTFDGKMNLLCTTYFKVLRKEKTLLKINILTVVISAVLCSISAFLYKNIYLVIISLVISVVFRSIVSELNLANVMKTLIGRSIITDVFLATLFVLVTWNFEPIYSFIVMSVTYCMYIYVNFSKVKKIISIFRKRYYVNE